MFSLMLFFMMTQTWNFAHAEKCVNKPGGNLKDLKGKRCPEMKPLELVKITIKEVKSWNSSYQHNSKLPEPQNLWQADAKDKMFKNLAVEVIKSSKINQEHFISDYFENRPQIKRTKEDEQPKPLGAIPAHELIKLEFSNGQSLVVGEYPAYTLSAPYDQLYKYVKTLTPTLY